MPTVNTQSTRLRSFLALETNVVVLSVAIALRATGMGLWSQFLPKYLEALGASIAVVAAFATVRQAIGALVQYPGGWITDRIGRRASLILFSLIGLVGYAVYLVAPTWQVLFLGIPFVLSGNMSMPAVFAMLGDSLPREKRAMGFTVQSVLRRLPMILAPPAGGLIIASAGLVAGVRWALAVTLGLAAIAVILQHRLYVEKQKVTDEPATTMSLLERWREIDSNLKRLLAADCAARFGMRMIHVFLIFYAVDRVGIDLVKFGILVGLQTAISVLSYLPVARLADRWRRMPFVVLTFFFFALFPAILIIADSFWWLCIAYGIWGLREIGEPARKALIVDLTPPDRRGRTIGIYRTIQSTATMPAPLLGGVLWTVGPDMLFAVAAAIGLVAVSIAATVKEGELAFPDPA